MLRLQRQHVQIPQSTSAGQLCTDILYYDRLQAGLTMKSQSKKTTPTMKDVAKEAGVSLGTVSKVFNNIPVGDMYRKKVEAAAEKLHYQVNNYARGLKTNKTFSIALLIPSLRHPFFAALADEITASLMSRGYRNILMITNYDEDAEQKCLTLVRQNKVDGIIGLTYNPNLEVDASIPFVTIDRHLSASISCVSSDNFRGGQMAAEKLLELGCRRLLFLRIGSDLYGEVNKRESGFESICRERQVSYHALTLKDSDTEKPFYTYLQDHIKSGRLDFDGIFCNSDLLAIHVIAFLKRNGLRIPEDVQIIGYDGIRDHYSDRYYCSTIVQPVRDMAETCVKLILMNDRTALPSQVLLPVQYAYGGTTRE